MMCHCQVCGRLDFLFRNCLFTANLLLFAEGIVMSWSVSIVPILNSNDTSVNPLPEPPTTFESSWIVASMYLGTIIGPFFGETIVTNFGKKKGLLICGVPVFLGHLIIAFATRVWMFIFSRFIMGLSPGCALGIITGFTGDVVENKNRGILGSFLLVFATFGALYTYMVAPFISIKLFSLTNLLQMILFYIIFGLFVPDTPYDLIQKNSIQEAKESLALFRGKNIMEVESEFEKLLDSQKKNKANSQTKVKTIELFTTIFKTKALRKGMIIVLSIHFFQSFTGMPAVGAYTQTIFDESGGSLKSTYSVMIIGLVSLLSITLFSQLVERAGRRILIIISYVFMVLPSFSLGTFFLLKSKEYNVEPISWLPIVSLIIFYIAINLQTAVPWILLTDIFPSKFLDICGHVASFTMFFTSFIVTLIYPFMQEAFGSYVSFYIFGICGGFAVIFCFISIPETKGKSVEEVQEILNRK